MKFINILKTILAFIIIQLIEIKLVDGLKIGVQIPPNSNTNNDLITEINLLNQEINSNTNNNNQLDNLNTKLNKILNSYLINNSCLRYYLSDYIKFSSIRNEINLKVNQGLLISFNFQFTNQFDSKIQKLNLSLIDKYGNILRRSNDIQKDELNFVIDFPIDANNEYMFKNEYFDLCFENLKYDKSWNSKAEILESSIEILFGMQSINEKYQKSTKLIDSYSNKLKKIDNELDIIIDQLLKNLKTSEPELRNKNEDTLEKYLKSFIIIFVIFIIVNILQVFWLIKYLKNHNLF